MQPRVKVRRPTAIDPVIDEISFECLLMRTQLILRVLSAEYEAALQPVDIRAARFFLLTVIGRLTLTHDLQFMLRPSLAEQDNEGVHARQLRLTADGAVADAPGGAGLADDAGELPRPAGRRGCGLDREGYGENYHWTLPIHRGAYATSE